MLILWMSMEELLSSMPSELKNVLQKLIKSILSRN
uniref:Uncharacterized protein n=1 Tax=Arcella intermedia TaxID=1963864 RepID=A0A6B2LVZ0_9EUKA